jgi:hypothetical protein
MPLANGTSHPSSYHIMEATAQMVLPVCEFYTHRLNHTYGRNGQTKPYSDTLGNPNQEKKKMAFSWTCSDIFFLVAIP